MRAASTPASSISDNSSSTVNFETLRCRPEVAPRSATRYAPAHRRSSRRSSAPLFLWDQSCMIGKRPATWKLAGEGNGLSAGAPNTIKAKTPRHNAEASEEYSKRSAAQRALLADYPKPTIACIRGFCLGGGMQVAMLADIRIASDDSQFGIPAAKLGIAYGYDGLKNLVSLVGPTWARLIMYTGMRIDSAEALRIGLVDRVVPDDSLWDETMEIARTISGNAPLAIQAAKITIAQVLKDEGQRDMEAIKQIGIACMDSEDFREGRRAFMEKRKPQFKGR